MALMAAGASLAVSASFLVSAPAQAATTYSGDECTASNANCFALFYNSGTNTWQSSCFLSNRSIPDLWGYSPNGATVVRLVFRAPGTYINTNLGASWCYGSGEGQDVKNNAAAAGSGEASATNTVYYNSGYSGASQSFAAKSSGNLNSTLKNENASIKRSS